MRFTIIQLQLKTVIYWIFAYIWFTIIFEKCFPILILGNIIPNPNKMASIRVYLKKSSAQEESGTIQVYVIFSRDCILRYPAGKKCLIKDWNPKSQRMRPCRDQAAINERIENLVAKITDILGTWQREGKDPDIVLLNNLLLQFDGKRITSGLQLSLLECVQQQSDNLKARDNKSYRMYDSLAIHVRNYEKIHGKVLVSKVGMEFLENWIQYFQVRKFAKVKSYSKNYIWGSVQIIKGVLQKAKDRGEMVPSVVFTSRFKAPQEEVENIYLSVDKLKKIAECKLLGRYERTRDLFIIQAFTGLRYSDVSIITMANFKEGYLSYIQKKTGGRVTLPLHPLVMDIIEKYRGILPKPKSNINMNEDLKVIGLQADLVEVISKTRTEGGNRITREYKEWEMITSHTARRSFATNCYLAGIPIISIMALTGHKTIASFMKYVKVGEKEIAESLKEHVFFKNT